MDVYEIVNALNQLVGLADSLDDTGVVGVKALTDGKHTTREALRLELSQFLLYVGNSNGNLVDGEVALLNLAMDCEYSAAQWKQIASSTDEPNPATSLTLMGFLSGDKALTQQSGQKTTSSTDILIQTFSVFGNLMVAFDENAAAKARCVKYISGMKSYVMKNL